jgi:MFS family permease
MNPAPALNGTPASHTANDSGETSIILLTSLAHALCHIGELIFVGVMLEVKREFGLHEVQVTALALLGYVLMGLGALPVGYLSDRWGPRRLLQIYWLAMAGAGLIVALASNVVFLFAGLTLLGLAASIYHPAGLAMLSLGVRRRGRAMGINGVAGSLGVACGPLLGSHCAALGTWRSAYVALAVLALAAAGFMALSRARFRDVEAQLFALHRSSLPSRGGTRAAAWLGVPLALVCIFIAMMLGGFNYRCLVTALPPFFSGNQPSEQELFKGGWLVFITLVMGGIGQFAGGRAADHFGARRVYPAILAVMVPVSAGLALLEGSLAALPIACGVAICLFAQQPVENSLLAEWTTARRRSISYGTKFALTFGIGALGTQAAGWIWGATGSMAPVFLVIAGSAAAMGLLSWHASRQRPELDREAVPVAPLAPLLAAEPQPAERNPALPAGFSSQACRTETPM